MAGLAELLLGKSNPFSQFISENQNKVSAAFGGLGSGTNFNEGLSRAAQGAALASPLDQAAAEKRQLANEGITARNKTAAYLRSQPGGAQFADAIENGMIDGSTAFKSWLDASKGPDPTASMRDFQFAQANPEFAGFLNGNGGGVTTGYTPIQGEYDGRAAVALPGNDGRLYINGAPIDPNKFVPTSTFEQAANRAAGTVAGKTTTETAAGLPSTIAQAEQSLANLSGLLPQLDATGNPVSGTNKGFDEQFGTIGIIPQQWLGALDGSEKAGFQARIEQVQGQSFLTAIDQLRGMGALSNAEGQTATRAITRISQKLPQGEFIKAVKELQDIVARGVERAKAIAAQSPGAGMLGVTPSAGGGNRTSTGVTYTVEP